MKMRVFFAFLVVGVAMLGPGWATETAQGASAQQNTAIRLVAPSACPPGGCAAGQRLSYQLEFELGAYDASRSDTNVKVCVYIPSSWYDASAVMLDSAGGITGIPYNNVLATVGCPQDLVPPTGYTLAAAGEAVFNNVFVFHDSLNFSFRISSTATAPGSVLMRVFELTSTGWVRTAQVFTPQMTPVPPAATLYVASDAASCAGFPCYLNSSDDLPGGIGTGLKDAVDTAPTGARIVVLGTVAIKGNTVQVNRQVSIEGSGEATLTSSGGCSNPMLEFSAGGALRGLNLNDGSCTAPDRTLVSVNSPADVIIESNDLTGGGDAIRVVNNTGNLTVRYNHIQGNSGYALYWGDNAPGGGLMMVANNVMRNRSGDPVECSAGGAAVAANRRIDHNYWGGASAPASTSTHCVVGAGKQLGAPIALNPAGPGVLAERITVTTNKTYRFNNQIAVRRSAEGGDFDLYLVDHGMAVPDAVPFTNSFAGSPNPCSDYWDVFLADGAVVSGSLELSLKYNRSSACVAAIESSQYCGQTASSVKFPLWWYDPAGQATSGWDTTGQNPAGSGAGGASGQGTSCNLALDEVTVTLDNSGRPALTSDLGYTPFVVGVIVPATFQTLASDQTVTVRWTTISEADLSGFYVMRSLAPNGPFDPVSDLIVRKGSALAGGDYTFVDRGRTNGVTNYYRLKIVRTDNSFFYSDILAIIPNPATVTPTLTPTRTITPRPSFTPFFRLPTPTRFPTLTRLPATPTRSGLGGLTATPTPFLMNTSSGSATATSPGYVPPGELDLTPGLTGSPNPSGYPPAGTSLAGSGEVSVTPQQTPGTLTPTSPGTPVVTQSRRNASDWISLVLGLALSGSVVLGLTWFLFLRRKPSE